MAHYASTSAFSTVRLSYAAAAAASLPPTATNHVIMSTYWRSSASILSSAQRYIQRPEN